MYGMSASYDDWKTRAPEDDYEYLRRWREHDARICGACENATLKTQECFACEIELCPDCAWDLDGEVICPTCYAGIEEAGE